MLVVVRVDGEHPAPQVPQQPRHDGTDATGADHADRLAGEIEPDEAVECEVAVADPVVGAVDPTVEGEDQRQRVLGHGVGRVGRHVDDHDSEMVGGVEVDVVVPGAPQCHAPDAGRAQRLEHRRVDGVVDEHADDVGARGEFDGGQVETGVEIHEPVVPIGRLEAFAVVGLGGEHPDLGHGADPYRDVVGHDDHRHDRVLDHRGADRPQHFRGDQTATASTDDDQIG